MLTLVTTWFSGPIGKMFLFDVGIQWVGWVFAVTFNTEKFYDLTGEISFFFPLPILNFRT